MTVSVSRPRRSRLHRSRPHRSRPHRRRRPLSAAVSAILSLVTVVGVAACTPAPTDEPSPSPSASSAPTVQPTPSPSPTPLPTGTQSPDRKLSASVTGQTKTILDSLVARTGAKDPRYYRDAVWVDGSAECFRCSMGPAVLAASYASTTGSARYRAIAVKSLDQAIADHQRSDGSFGPPAPGEDGPAIQTVFFANSLATSYLMLKPDLDAAHRKSWSKALTRSADYLIKSGLLSFYVNGNINFSVAVNLDLTYRITGQKRFRTASATALDFTLHPPQGRWSGFGLTYAKKPSRSDGSDGAGYLGESGGQAPGFDVNYTAFQADIASNWFLLTGRPIAGRLSNLFFNQLRPRIRTSDWTLDVSGGTRRGAPGTRYPFDGPVLAILALRGGRTDLAPLVAPQAGQAVRQLTGGTTYTHSTVSSTYGVELAPLLYVIATTKR